MFTYCLNNPVSYIDLTGLCPHDGKFYTSGPYKGQYEYSSACNLCAAHGEFWLCNRDSGQMIDVVQNQTEFYAHIVYSYLTEHGASHNATCAILGNMQRESGINPARHQNGGGGGFGLVQWVPGTKYTKWAAQNGYANDSIYGQLEFLLYTMQPGPGEWFPCGKHSGYYLSYGEFISSNASISYLTAVFCHSYERAGVLAMNERIAYAESWSVYFS